MPERKGVIFPLYTEMTKRAIENGKDVFVKFSGRDIKPGMDFYIYGTGENGVKKIIAKAKVKNTDRMRASKVWDKYGSRLFQNKDEFNEYIRGRRSKEMLVLELEDTELLDEQVKAPGYMSVAGLYVDEKKKEKIEQRIS